MLRRKKSSSSKEPLFEEGAGLCTQEVYLQGQDMPQKEPILKNINVDIRAQCTGILGLNGSGKTSFLKLFNGLVTPSSGSIQVDGVRLDHYPQAIRRRVGFLFADPLTQLIMPTPLEDIELSLQSSIPNKQQRRKQALELLASRGLADRAHHSIYHISGGERQLTALLTLLAVEPKILLLDEPTTLLDLRNKIKFIDLIKTLPQQLLISTHDLDLAQQCDQLLILNAGQLLAQGPAEDMLTQYRHWCSSGFPNPTSRQQV